MKYQLRYGLIALVTVPSAQGLLHGCSLRDTRVITDGTLAPSSTALRVSSTSPNFQRKEASSSDGESEAERLLRLARKLRQQAEEEEQNVHEHLYQKKRKEDEQLDQWIENLSLAEASKKNRHAQIVKQLKDRKPCMDTLERIVDRLHEHHLVASGHECVQAPSKEGKSHISSVQRVHHPKDDDRVQKIELQAEALFEAIDVVDDELHRLHRGESSDPAHAESRHWGGDQRAKQLRNRWHGLLREHAEQFLKRQASFVEAQRVKKENPPPPKAKDDHGLVP